MIDIHSHILPCIDDGARSMLESINILSNASLNGVTDVILTPHYIDESIQVCNNKEKFDLLKKLREEVNKNNININLYLGNEVFISNNVIDLLKNREIYTLNGSRYLLMEFSMGYYPNEIDDVLDSLFKFGIIPVIAHPERYIYLYNNIDFFKYLVDRGCLLQCNIGSLFGEYGKSAKKMVKLLLKNNLVSFFASDIHRQNSSLYDYDIEGKLYKILKDKNKVKDLLINNQLKVINDENL